MILKYGSWKIAEGRHTEKILEAGGYSPLTASVLSGRGCGSVQEAQDLLRADAPLIDPLEMKEMDRAVAVLRQALSDGVKMAVFGDYDVDGITATCVLTDYLRSRGADCLTHIPGRLEEGYGLNESAIYQLFEDGVRLIITVDCGITAIDEAELCRRLGITLIITDHHECKEQLPRCAALIDPHRPDCTYPHQDLSGVGIAFKLAAALEGDQDAIEERYCDLVCLGTIADVMPLRGENRRLVVKGLQALQNPKRIGLRALLDACECHSQALTANTIGYVIAPRINAAGRMERADLAVQLFLTSDAREAESLAQTLCELNRERQATETEIYKEASVMLRSRKLCGSAIVLAGERWHQGVVGIVASRLAEEYSRPTFLICLSGDKGKASSRSFGGFNLFASLAELSHLLEGYGGHALAAGFTISRKNIDEFRRCVCRLVESHAAEAGRSVLEIDCEPDPSALTEENIEGLSQLEPCGIGCPKPVFCLCETQILRMSTVGNGKHLRLRLLTRDGTELQALYFGGGGYQKHLRVGQRLDVAFHLTVNEFRGQRNVQLNVLDLRAVDAQELYDRFLSQQPLDETERRMLAPTRKDVVAVWRYLEKNRPIGAPLHCTLEDFAIAVAASTENRHSIRRTIVCLEILKELGLLSLRREYTKIELRLLPEAHFNPLENSRLYRNLGGD